MGWASQNNVLATRTRLWALGRPGLRKPAAQKTLRSRSKPASNILQRQEIEAAVGKLAVSIAAVDEISAAIQTFVRERASR